MGGLVTSCYHQQLVQYGQKHVAKCLLLHVALGCCVFKVVVFELLLGSVSFAYWLALSSCIPQALDLILDRMISASAGLRSRRASLPKILEQFHLKL